MNAVAIPWPSRMLSPNARVHHMPKARAIRTYRATVNWLASAQRGRKRLQKPVLGVLTVSPTRRRRDIDNVLASLKSALDGLTDNGWWDDDCLIESITVLASVHATGWTREPVVIVADEAERWQDMVAAMRAFRDAVATSPDDAWRILDAD